MGMLKAVYMTSETFKYVEHEKDVAICLYIIDVVVSPKKDVGSRRCVRYWVAVTNLNVLPSSLAGTSVTLCLRAAVDNVAGSTALPFDLGMFVKVAAASDMLPSFACLAVMLPKELVGMLPASLPSPLGVEPEFAWGPESVWDLPSYESRPP